MGLFNYLSNIGKKLFGDDEDQSQASEKIKAHIEKDNPGVENLEVSLDDGVATLTGYAEDEAAMEKAILLAGDVQGFEKVEAAGLEAPPHRLPKNPLCITTSRKGTPCGPLPANTVSP